MFIETFVVGLLISCLFIALTGLYPGGIIVPVYFSIHLDQPLRTIGTVTLSILIWIIYRLLAQWLIVFGHRRFALLLFLSAFFGILSHRVLPTMWPVSLELRAIGWLIPGILANSFERQGIWRSLCGLVVVTVATYFVVHLAWG